MKEVDGSQTKRWNSFTVQPSFIKHLPTSTQFQVYKKVIPYIVKHSEAKVLRALSGSCSVPFLSNPQNLKAVQYVRPTIGQLLTTDLYTMASLTHPSCTGAAHPDDCINHFQNCLNQALEQMQMKVDAHFQIYRSDGVNAWEPLRKLVNTTLAESLSNVDTLVANLKKDIESERTSTQGTPGWSCVMS